MRIGEAEMKKVDSESIDSFHYNEETETLTVRFANGSLYVYGRVPQELVEEGFEKNEGSVGSYFCSKIKGKFQCVRLS